MRVHVDKVTRKLLGFYSELLDYPSLPAEGELETITDEAYTVLQDTSAWGMAVDSTPIIDDPDYVPAMMFESEEPMLMSATLLDGPAMTGATLLSGSCDISGSSWGANTNYLFDIPVVGAIPGDPVYVTVSDEVFLQVEMAVTTINIHGRVSAPDMVRARVIVGSCIAVPVGSKISAQIIRHPVTEEN